MSRFRTIFNALSEFNKAIPDMEWAVEDCGREVTIKFSVSEEDSDLLLAAIQMFAPNI